MSLSNQFRYERPTSLEDLRALLTERKRTEPRYLAGGTDLQVAMRAGKIAPKLVVDLKGLSGLSGISQSAGKLWIGSLTTIHSLETSELIRTRATTLFEAARSLGSWQVRNRGTVGGNLANGAPTADTAAPFLALDAEILTWNVNENRRIPAASFWLGAGKTALGPGEVITGVEIPLAQEISSAYTKLGPRRAMDIAIASAAVVLKTDRGIVLEARIALGGAGPTPIRARSAESHLTGRAPSPENISQAGKMAAAESNPRTSARATREYRLFVIPVLVERTIRAALEGRDCPRTGEGGEGR